MANVLVTTRMSDSALSILKDAGHELFVCDAPGWEEKRDMVQKFGCEAVACRGGAFPKEFFETLPNLRILALPSAGYDGVDLQTAEKNGTVVTNAGDGNAKSVAELAFMLMLAAAKHLKTNMQIAASGNAWRAKKQQTFTEVSDKTVALLGYGNIARELGLMCRAFSMRVIAYHPHIEQKALPEGFVPCNDLFSAIRDADFVSCHIPARPENVHFLSDDAFAAMKPGAIFVNTGRGSVADTDALVRALESGHLAGAGLDVFEEEPLPADSPLLSLENVICTPHVGGETIEAKRRVYEIAAKNVARVLAGEAPISPVFAK